MSFYAMAWALKQPVRTASQKLVLIALADAFNERDGYAWPSYALLSEQTCMSRSTIIRTIQDLEVDGLVVTQNCQTEAGRNTSKAYFLPGYSEIQGDLRGVNMTPLRSVRGVTMTPTGVSPRHPNLEEEPKVPPSEELRRPRRRSSSSSRTRPQPDDTTGSTDEAPALGASRKPNREAREQAAVETGTSGWGLARRLQLALADAKSADMRIVDVKALARRLNDRHRGGESRETQQAMVELFALNPSRYVQGDQKGWTAFLAAAPKLAADVGASSRVAPTAYAEDPYAAARGRRAASA